MIALYDSLLVSILLLNLFALGSSRIHGVIRIVALQGVLLGVMPVLAHPDVGLTEALISIVMIAIKGIVIPKMLFSAMDEVHIRREVEPLIGFLPSVLLGALVTGLSLVFSGQLPLIEAHKGYAGWLVVPTALSTILVGFIQLTSRNKAINQVLGYLILENGIFIFGLLLLQTMPFLVEIGILLDLLVAIFVISIVINHINREFASLDTRKLSLLRE